MPRKKEKDELYLQFILAIDAKYNGLYGYRMLREALIKEYGLSLPLGTVQRLMSANGILSRYREKKRRPYNLDEKIFRAENMIRRNFHARRPLEKILSDVTEIDVGPKRMFLCIVFDLFGSYPLAYSLSDKNDTELVMSALRQIKFTRSFSLIFHSDQGANYTCWEVHNFLTENDILISMSNPGTPLDNSPMESFNGLFKDTMSILYGEPKTIDELIKHVDDTMYFIRYTRPFPGHGTIPKIDYYTRALKAMREAEADPDFPKKVPLYPKRPDNAYGEWWDKQMAATEKEWNKEVEKYRKILEEEQEEKSQREEQAK